MANYDFPDFLVEQSIIKEMTSSAYNRAKNSLCAASANKSKSPCIKYVVAPWRGMDLYRKEGSVDLILSQAVLEHVDDLDDMHSSIYRCLRPGGVASHVIDYKSHDVASRWNGHYTYSDFIWKRIIRGRRPYLINRMPHSKHIALFRKQGHRTITGNVEKAVSELKRTELAQRFRDLSEEDLTACGAIIQVVK